MDLITDRTQADVLLGNAKGTYGYDDLNRVERAVAEIAAAFPRLGIGARLQTKTDWAPPGAFSQDSWPVESQMRRYLGNVSVIRDAFQLPGQLPGSMEALTWVDANRIEEVLRLADAAIAGITEAMRYSCELFAGEED